MTYTRHDSLMNAMSAFNRFFLGAGGPRGSGYSIKLAGFKARRNMSNTCFLFFSLVYTAQGHVTVVLEHHAFEGHLEGWRVYYTNKQHPGNKRQIKKGGRMLPTFESRLDACVDTFRQQKGKRHLLRNADVCAPRRFFKRLSRSIRLRSQP